MIKAMLKMNAIIFVCIVVTVSCGPRKDNTNAEETNSQFPTAPAMDQPIVVNPDLASSNPEVVVTAVAQTMPSHTQESVPEAPLIVEVSTQAKPVTGTKDFDFTAQRLGELDKDINPLTVFQPTNDLGGFDERIKEGMSEEFQVYYKYLSGLVSRSLIERSVSRFDENSPALTSTSAQIVTKIESSLDTTLLPGYTEQHFKCDQVVRNTAIKSVNCQKVREFIHDEDARRKISRQLGVTLESYKTCRIRNYKNENAQMAEQHELLNVKQIQRDTGVYILQSGQKIEKIERRIIQEVGEVICGDATNYQYIGKGIRTTEVIMSYENPSLEFLDQSIAKEIARVEEIQLEEAPGKFKPIQQSRIELIQMYQNGKP